MFDEEEKVGAVCAPDIYSSMWFSGPAAPTIPDKFSSKQNAILYDFSFLIENISSFKRRIVAITL